MSKLFAISDLHLSFGCNKPMDVFRGWENYTERIRANWLRTVGDNDTVVIAGDISWAMDTQQALPDFMFLHDLPGKKIIMKGNHDFWWGTVSKLNGFFSENGLNDFFILHNNCYPIGKYAVCGSRGWEYDSPQKDEKIVLRECGRIAASLNLAAFNGLEPILFLHFPPAYGDMRCEEIIGVIKEHNANTLYYGHLHGLGASNRVSAARAAAEIRTR